jgi:hypothetical protein
MPRVVGIEPILPRGKPDFEAPRGPVGRGPSRVSPCGLAPCSVPLRVVLVRVSIDGSVARWFARADSVWCLEYIPSPTEVIDLDKQAYEAAVRRLNEVNTVIKSLDEAIRGDAFAVLRPYIDGKGSTAVKGSAKSDEMNEDDDKTPLDVTNAEAFVRSRDLEKPSEAVYAIAAWWFSQYGSTPLTTTKLQEIADEIGVTIPARPDMTLKSATADNKNLFRKAGRGMWVPTQPHGELHFKEEYGITKGRAKPPDTA